MGNAFEAETRLLTARLRLFTATKHHTAAVVIGRPANREQAVAKFRAADDLRRAETEYQAALAAAQGATRA